jgi:hypothetical protein
MRTKTLILSGLLAALSGASALAQVYSLNAVGYINVLVPHGWSIITDPLYAVNQQTAQTIDQILGPTLLNGGATTPDPYAGIVIFPWNANPASQGYYSALVVSQSPGFAPFWSLPGEATGTSFNPGQAMWIYNPSAEFTLTFVGTVPQGTVNNTLQPGWNMVGSLVPIVAAMDSAAVGLVPTPGDVLFTYANNNAGIEGYNTADVANTGGQWSQTVAPTLQLGQGLFYYNRGPVATNWVTTFTIQP